MLCLSCAEKENRGSFLVACTDYTYLRKHLLWPQASTATRYVGQCVVWVPESTTLKAATPYQSPSRNRAEWYVSSFVGRVTWRYKALLILQSLN